MRWLSLTAALLLSVPGVSAEIRVEVGPDGRKVFSNTAPAKRSPSLDRALQPGLVSQHVDRSAARHGLDPHLVHAVIRAESAYNPRAVSPKGAVGLMQLMPATAHELSVDDPFDPASNIEGGSSYLRRMLDRFDGNLELALAGYNAGPEAVRRFGGVPPYRETRQYVERVLRTYHGDADYRLPVNSTTQIGRKSTLR